MRLNEFLNDRTATKTAVTILSVTLIILLFLQTPAGSLTAQGNSEPAPALRNLPPVLQALVEASPPNGNNVLYQIPGVFTAVSVSGSGKDDSFVYLPDVQGVSWQWQARDDTFQTNNLLGFRALMGLAKGASGNVAYAWQQDEVLKLVADRWELLASERLNGVGDLIVSPDDKTLFANLDDSIWRWTEEQTGWERLDIPVEEWLKEDAPLKVNSSGDIYTVELMETLDQRGYFNGYVEGVAVWTEETQEWQPANWNMGEDSQVNDLDVSGDGRNIWAVTTHEDGQKLWIDGINWPTPAAIFDDGITSLLLDPEHDNNLYIGNNQGLYLTRDPLSEPTLVGLAANGRNMGGSVRAIAYHPYWHVPLIAASSGVYFLVLPQKEEPVVALGITVTGERPLAPEPTATQVPAIQKVLAEYKEKAWLWPVTTIGGFVSAYILGILALILSAWRGGSAIFSRSHLISIASSPLFITPGLGRWALFLGYKQRLLKHKSILRAARDYFGLPATSLSGTVILPDPTGKQLHQHIGQQLGPRQPVLVIGMGGAGKSTLLARWAYLALTKSLPASLNSLRPVLVTPAYYDGNLVKAISDVLREREGLAVTEEIVQTQLQSGRYLILFDGVSEIEQDKQDSLREILRTARHADYARCRFLIATRPLAEIPTDIASIHLQPLTPDVVLNLLPRYELDREHERQVRRQLQSFGGKPIAPLLLSMVMAQSDTTEISRTQAQLYETYFQRLLGVDKDSLLWAGWRTALEMLAQWFMLDTGKRGIGLAHEPLLDLIVEQKDGHSKSASLVERLQRFYQLPVKDELDLLQRLEAANLVQSGRRWRFAHDTFEEYFAASRLIFYYDNHGQWLDLHKWQNSPEQQEEFLEVITLVSEMADEPIRQQFLELDMPIRWQTEFNKTNLKS